VITATKQALRERIVVVEDDGDISKILEHILCQQGYDVTVAGNGSAALRAIRDQPPDLVVLDLMLPDMSGLEILKSLRQDAATAKTRVIIVTARKDEVDRIVGFELGADDYVMKPFSPRELALRVRAVLQRFDGAAPQQKRIFRAGPIEVDVEHHRATVDGQPLDLTLTEFKLLSELVRSGSRVRTREALLSDVWGYDSEVMSRTVDTHIRRLRSKLGDASSWLSTVRGVGYKIESPDRPR
jgi:two-component system phosphate regulon response regulator PhoB